MKEQNENPFMVKKIQDGLNKLISEEYIAYQIYMISRIAVCNEDTGFIDNLFAGIADDELSDHMKELINWCREYKYEIPCCEREFKKYADTKLIRILNCLKKKQNAGYYIDQAIASEKLSIDSYKKIIEYKEVCQFTDLQSLLWHIYYDEQEHMTELNSAKIAFDAGCDITQN